MLAHRVTCEAADDDDGVLVSPMLQYRVQLYAIPLQRGAGHGMVRWFSPPSGESRCFSDSIHFIARASRFAPHGVAGLELMLVMPESRGPCR
jgi:hypothetical protein